MSDRRIEYVSIDAVKPAPRNPKDHDLGALAESVERFGFTEPALMDERTGRLVAGHGRIETLRSLRKAGKKPPKGVSEDWKVPVVRGWASRTDAEADAYLVASNRLTELGGWHEDQLAELLSDLASKDALGGTGYDNDDVDKLMRDAGMGEPKEDEVPEPVKDSWVKPGDMFALGEHRLLCGDSTKAEDVHRVMGDEKAALCLTDPPYGIGEGYDAFDDSQESLMKLVDGFFALAMSISDVVLLTPGNINQSKYPKPTWTLAWFTQAGAGSGPWGFSCWQPVMAFGKDPFLANGLGRRPDALVMTESAENTLCHPCPKPIGVWTWILERGSVARGDIVFEPFSGSGTTIIACESKGRLCRAIELTPAYAQVAIERWEKYTGKKAVKLQ